MFLWMDRIYTLEDASMARTRDREGTMHTWKSGNVLSTLVCSQVKLFHVVDLKNKKAVIYGQYTFKHA